MRLANFLLIFSLTFLFAPLRSLAQDIDPSTGLAIAPGWKLVRANCGGCHSFKLVTMQQGDHEQWLAAIRWMQDSQNLWRFDLETENKILTYLSKNYAPQPKRRRAPIPPKLMPSPTAM